MTKKYHGAREGYTPPEFPGGLLIGLKLTENFAYIGKPIYFDAETRLERRKKNKTKAVSRQNHRKRNKHGRLGV